MFVIRLMQWPITILMVAVVAVLLSAAVGAWINTPEFKYHYPQQW